MRRACPRAHRLHLRPSPFGAHRFCGLPREEQPYSHGTDDERRRGCQKPWRGERSPYLRLHRLTASATQDEARAALAIVRSITRARTDAPDGRRRCHVRKPLASLFFTAMMARTGRAKRADGQHGLRGLLAGYGAARGVEPETMLAVARIGLDDLAHVDRRMSVHDVWALWEFPIQKLDDWSIPLRIAQSTTVEDHAVMGFAILTSAHGDDALDRAVRYGGLFTEAGTWRRERWVASRPSDGAPRRRAVDLGTMRPPSVRWVSSSTPCACSSVHGFGWCQGVLLSP